jgi:predicted transposase YdaD
LEEGIQIGEARGREKGIQIGEARGREKGIQIGETRGILSTIVNFVVRHLVTYEDGLKESGLTDEEFRAKIAEVDPNFQR